MKARKTGSGTRDLIRPDLRQLAGYTAVEPVERLVKDGDTGQPSIESRPTVKLDANENPYGPSPRVLRAIAGSSALHVYPDAEQQHLRTALGDYVGLGAEHIVVGNGSDDILDLITRLTLEPGDRVINCTPTFGMYKFVTEVSGGVLVEVSRNDHYGLDLDAIEKSIDDRTKIVFIASPNNPTGNSSSRDEIVRLLETGLAVVVDEAYFEFSGQTMASLVPDYDNLMVVRTFSKWAGLAGVRVGYGIFSPRIADYINQIKQPYNVSVFAQMAALE
ncbi:MAG: aminotransferase class I/II-fold pyridoxal phosphate-dependent enzyme [Chloroflexi bacterium]|nr:aminotransferase class I/II-fold pyridoxal phosphate-dependent enzyme [Chloroflexota bacterium]